MLIIVEMTQKLPVVCPGCEFSAETEDGNVYCANSKCIFYLRSTTCRCGMRTLPEEESEHVG
ncbi:MAG TPA: hypothetical protein VN538_12575 [Clostridia bacterium]|nr:hypothetical protein [Clostridia bacterium]